MGDDTVDTEPTTDEPTTDPAVDEAPEGAAPEDAVEAAPEAAEPYAKAPAPPGWKPGDNWNSDDARRAYEAAGTTLEEEQSK